MNTTPAGRKSKIGRRILVGLLLTVCLAVISLGFSLKKGIRVDTLAVGQVTVSNFFLQWRDKLEVQIDTVTVNEQERAGFLKDFSFIDNGFRVVGFLGSFFSRATVKIIRMGDLTGTLYLDSGRESSYFTLSSSDLRLHSNLLLKENSLTADIKELSSKRFNSRATGQILFNGGEKHITGTLAADLAGVLPVTVDFIADQQQVSFKGEEAGVINDITPFVDLFGLDKNIQRWITDYSKVNLYTLKAFEGKLPWNDPGALLDTLYAEVGIEDFEYTFAPGDPGLEPVKADYTDVIFNKKILTITPHESMFYEQGVGDSRVEIDFADLTNIILTLYIKAHARANDDILALLSYYNIDLPFKQTAGRTETDFILALNLNKQQIENKGTFLIGKGIVEFDGKKFGMTNTRIVLDNDIITIDGKASFEKLFVAGISGKVEIKTGVSDLDITLEKVSFDTGKSEVTLAESGPRPVIKYHIRPDGQYIDVSSSSWYLDSQQCNFGPFSAPFSPKELSINLPPTPLTILPGISSKISGFFSIKEKKVDIHSELLKYQRKDLTLQSSSVPISIQYDQELTIQTNKTSHWKMNNILTTLYPSEFKYADNVLSIISGRMRYGDFFDRQITGQYNSLIKQGSFLLEDLYIREKDFGELLGSPSGISVKVSDKEGKLIIKMPELDLMISTSENKGWSAKFRDLATVHQRSILLQQYLVDSGSLTIVSKNGKKPYSFTAEVPYRYPILVKDGSPVDRLNISGEITSEGWHATVNEEMQIHYSDQLTIISKDIGFSIPAIVTLLKELPKSAVEDPEKKKRVRFTIDAANSGLFFRKSAQMLADKIHLDYDDGRSIVRLEHGQGHIDFDLEGDNFSLEGKNLNNNFMAALVQGANFTGGRMSVAVKGTSDTFSALFKIENTILTEFKALNNIFAFINTIPALVTFSLPEYSSRGLPINSVVVGMVVEEGLATLESFKLESPEISMTGSGWINFPQNRIDMDLNLITQAKKNISKIPLAGYILVGNEKRPSVTVKISGDLLNPKVENSTVKEVITLPFAILLRTLALPLHLVDSMIDSTEDRDGK